MNRHKRSTQPLRRFKFLCVALSAAILAYPGSVFGEGLTLELTGVRQANDTCLGALSIVSDYGQALDRLRLELVVFAKQNKPIQRYFIDLAPLNPRTRTQVNIPLSPVPCGALERIQIRDIPQCRAVGGGKLDCLEDLKLSGTKALRLSR